MKFFLRGLMALGLPALLATIASAQNPAPAQAAPAQGQVASSGGCSSCGSYGTESGSKRKYGFFGRYNPPPGGDRVDHLVARKDALGQCKQSFLQRLAGPQVDPQPGSCGKGPNTQPGTVVFPQHPFIRSPRDYFMQD